MMVLAPAVKCKADKLWTFIIDELANCCSPLRVYLR